MKNAEEVRKCFGFVHVFRCPFLMPVVFTWSLLTAATVKLIHMLHHSDLQRVPKECWSLDSRKKYFPAWCCRKLFFLWKDIKSDLLPINFRSTERTAQLPQRRQLFQIYLLGLLRRWEGAIWTAEINVATSKLNVCARRITTGLSKIVVCCVCTT